MNKLLELKESAQNISVLYVEDEKDLRENVAIFLKKIFGTVTVAKDGKEGLDLYSAQKYDIIISDILMPNLNGMEMLQQIKTLDPSQTNIIITSAYTEREYFVNTIKIGIFSYIVKPIDYEQMIDVLHAMVTKINQVRELDQYHTNLENMVQIKVNEYKLLQHERTEDYEKMLLALVKMIEQRDSYTAGHSQRVAHYTKLLAKDLGYDDHTCELLYKAGILHDIGKIATPDAVLLKPDNLTPIEYRLIKEHVMAGVNILKDIPLFQNIVEIIKMHHERYDGLGYPQGLKGDEIPPISRIMMVADAFDAMTTSRIYRHKRSVNEALFELQQFSSIQFHPEVVQSAQRVFANLTIDTSFSQLPVSELEEERFVYFYKDSVTTLYNHKYLSIALLQNNYSHFYTRLSVLSLHGFSQYNDLFGWDAGDALLQKCATILRETYGDALLFRIHANDFIVMKDTTIPFDKPFQKELVTLLKDPLSYSINHFSIQKASIDSIEELETVLHQTKLMQQKEKVE